jgi:hypothetical protein
MRSLMCTTFDILSMNSSQTQSRWSIIWSHADSSPGVNHQTDHQFITMSKLQNLPEECLELAKNRVDESGTGKKQRVLKRTRVLLIRVEDPDALGPASCDAGPDSFPIQYSWGRRSLALEDDITVDEQTAPKNAYASKIFRPDYCRPVLSCPKLPRILIQVFFDLTCPSIWLCQASCDQIIGRGPVNCGNEAPCQTHKFTIVDVCIDQAHANRLNQQAAWKSALSMIFSFNPAFSGYAQWSNRPHPEFEGIIISITSPHIRNGSRNCPRALLP